MKSDYALTILEDYYGVDLDTLVEIYAYDSTVPGVCLDCGAVTESIEPDQREGWCASCDSRRVASLLTLAGIL
ncbi:MAG: hypothetical protein KatS3mg015_2754 [Fimbriimonadales bacterium]|nr:MAG: hypothetical protein KatS3mg015_2754 [Fimbriimonadales bacterium]